MRQAIERSLQKLSTDNRIISNHPVSGGDINEAYYVETSEEN